MLNASPAGAVMALISNANIFATTVKLELTVSTFMRYCGVRWASNFPWSFRTGPIATCGLSASWPVVERLTVAALSATV
jgi:hypothetical protein